MSDEPTPAIAKNLYVVRNGRFKGRNLKELSVYELRQMVLDIPKDEDAIAGVRLMNWILDNKGAETLKDFVEWGQNILDETGKITEADFSADPDESPNTPEEKAMLKAARPNVLNRRNVLLVVPSAIIASFTAMRLGLKGLATLIRSDKDEELDDQAPAQLPENRLEKLSTRLEEYSSTPLETLNIGALLFEVIDGWKDYSPAKFDQISNAVAKIADDMGIGEPTPTFRLSHKSHSQDRSSSHAK